MNSAASKLELFSPDFSSPLTDLIIELDYLRKKKLGGSTIPQIFFQLKSIFHTLESIGSARIEGNHTTIAEYIEYKIRSDKPPEMNVLEIINMEKALDFIDENIANTSFSGNYTKPNSGRSLASVNLNGNRSFLNGNYLIHWVLADS
jgi:Fic family protein